MAEVYPPLEDSLLLAAEVRKHAAGKVLDMGCGSGVQTANALKKKQVLSVLGVDINKQAVAHCRKTIKNRKASFIVSDLLKKVPKKQFDTILFNPPYLPADEYPDDPATIGGKEGWETIARFLNAAPDYLTPKGKILLLFTSRTDKKKVHESIATSLLDWKVLATNHIAFETYYVYLLTKNNIRLDAEKNGVKNIRYFSHGKRGIIFTGFRRGKTVALKTTNPQTAAIGRLGNEARILKCVNKKGIGPKFVLSTKNIVCYEFAKGVLWKDWLPNASAAAVLRVLRNVIRQCKVLDELGIQKEEMHHPHKHIVIGKKVTLLDFERGRMTEHPHNVTQYLEFISRLAPALKNKGMVVDKKKLRTYASRYARFPDAKTFKPILEAIKKP